MIDHLILAQEDAAAGGGAGTLILLVVMVAFFYFLFIRPQRKRQQEQQQLQSAIEIGDQVQTIGGIRGIVNMVDDDSVIIQLEDGRMRVSKRAINARVGPES